jgi:hypothetical protein
MTLNVLTPGALFTALGVVSAWGTVGIGSIHIQVNIGVESSKLATFDG